MNKKIYSILLILFAGIYSVMGQGMTNSTDTLSMYPGYSNDIYYSMTNGEIANIPRAGWDIAFYTNAFSAGIIINEGFGVELYSYPNGDTADWATVDTTGLSTWTPLYNSPELWEDGAFNVGATGHPDYGWGVYNMVTHSVVGDSLYIIKTSEGNYKKLWIVQKISVDNLYEVKFANIDGSEEIDAPLDIKPYTEKNFVYYSIDNNNLFDREPLEDWDIMFTKYIDFTQDMSGNMVEYLVTGATSNVDHFANKFTEVGADFDDWSSQPFDSLKNTIGYDWKSFDMGTFSWVVDDSTAFFVKNTAGDVYKLVFTYWAGAGSGEFALNKEMVSATSVDDITIEEAQFSLFPNPASGEVTVNLSDEVFNGTVVLSDLSGKTILRENITGSKVLSVSELDAGIYFVTIYNDDFRETNKLFVR